MQRQIKARSYSEPLPSAAACERSSADLVVVQLQDACGLGDDSRMNLPGVAEGNWSWVADARDIEAATRRMRSLAEQTGRL